VGIFPRRVEGQSVAAMAEVAWMGNRLPPDRRGAEIVTTPLNSSQALAWCQVLPRLASPRSINRSQERLTSDRVCVMINSATAAPAESRLALREVSSVTVCRHPTCVDQLKYSGAPDHSPGDLPSAGQTEGQSAITADLRRNAYLMRYAAVASDTAGMMVKSAFVSFHRCAASSWGVHDGRAAANALGPPQRQWGVSAAM
jgi:hypothetical protein